MVWAVLVGLIAWALIVFNHIVFTRKQGATAAHYGITEETMGCPLLSSMDTVHLGTSTSARGWSR